MIFLFSSYSLLSVIVIITFSFTSTFCFVYCVCAWAGEYISDVSIYIYMYVCVWCAFAASHYSISWRLFAIVMVMPCKIWKCSFRMHLTFTLWKIIWYFYRYKMRSVVYYRRHVYTSVSMLNTCERTRFLNCAFFFLVNFATLNLLSIHSVYQIFWWRMNKHTHMHRMKTIEWIEMDVI